jgi:hypothetical protein
MSEERVKLTRDEAAKLLTPGESVHTFKQAGPVLIGADWRRNDLLKLADRYGAELSGEQATAMGHGVVHRFGRCMDCANWRPQGDRSWSKRGACDQHERAMTSYDSGCNNKFLPVNTKTHVQTGREAGGL